MLCVLQNFVRAWSTYQPKLKLLKEMRLRKETENKLKIAAKLKERSRAALIIQKHWRGYRYKVYICTYVL